MRAFVAVVPLLLLAVAELRRLQRGLAGAIAFAVDSGLGWLSLALCSLVAVCGFAAFVRGGGVPQETSPSGSWAAAQRLFGYAGWAFAATHVVGLWISQWAVGGDALGQYEFLRNWLASPFNVAVYAAGLSAMFAYLAQGIPVTMSDLGWIKNRRQQGGAELAGMLLGLALFIWSVNVMSHFSGGQALWGYGGE